MTATRKRNWDPRCYIGVDLETEEVVMIGKRPEHVVGNAYTLTGVHSPKLDGTIFVDTDDQSFNGRRALAIALADQNQDIGLGWTFRVRESDSWSA